MKHREAPFPHVVSNTDSARTIWRAPISVRDFPFGEEPRVVPVGLRLEQVPFPRDGVIAREDALDERADPLPTKSHLSGLRADNERIIRHDSEHTLHVLTLHRVPECIENGTDVPRAQLVGIWQLTPVPASPQYPFGTL